MLSDTATYQFCRSGTDAVSDLADATILELYNLRSQAYHHFFDAQRGREQPDGTRAEPDHDDKSKWVGRANKCNELLKAAGYQPGDKVWLLAEGGPWVKWHD